MNKPIRMTRCSWGLKLGATAIIALCLFMVFTTVSPELALGHPKTAVNFVFISGLFFAGIGLANLWGCHISSIYWDKENIFYRSIYGRKIKAPLSKYVSEGRMPFLGICFMKFEDCPTWYFSPAIKGIEPLFRLIRETLVISKLKAHGDNESGV